MSAERCSDPLSIPSVLMISDRNDLAQLWHRPRSRAPVAVRLLGIRLEDGRRRKFERRIERHLAACGCNEGALAGLLYLVATCALLTVGHVSPGSTLGWIGLGAGALAALVVGKIFGLALAHIRLKRVIKEVEPHLVEAAHV